MNIQELATAHVEKIAAKAIILNNQHLGMVVQWEDNFYAGNRGHTYLGDPEHRPEIYPDYVRVCNSFGVKCERVMFKKDLRAAIQRMLDADEPYVLDVITPYSTHVIPFIPAGKTVADMIWKAMTLRGYTNQAMQFAKRHDLEIVAEVELARMLETTDAQSDAAVLELLRDTRKFCPKCEREMVIRIARQGPNPGGKFWGCSGYPECHFTMPMAETVATPVETAPREELHSFA